MPILWALYNLLPPILFFVYFFTKGRFLQLLCTLAQVLGLLLALGECVFEGGRGRGGGLRRG